MEEFNLGEHKTAMNVRHPSWSDRQSGCVLYWQGHVRKNLREQVAEMIGKYPGTVSTLWPEAMGVHVIRTARAVGIPIKTRPQDKVYKIALVGYPQIGQ